MTKHQKTRSTVYFLLSTSYCLLENVHVELETVLLDALNQ